MKYTFIFGQDQRLFRMIKTVFENQNIITKHTFETDIEWKDGKCYWTSPYENTAKPQEVQNIQFNQDWVSEKDIQKLINLGYPEDKIIRIEDPKAVENMDP